MFFFSGFVLGRIKISKNSTSAWVDKAKATFRLAPQHDKTTPGITFALSGHVEVPLFFAVVDLPSCLREI